MRIKIRYWLVIVILASFLASYIFPGVEENKTIESSITFIGVLFGLIVGFFITHLYSRYNGIRTSAALDSTSLSSLYFLATIMREKDKQLVKELKNKINNYIEKFMSLPWHRYSETEKEYSAIGDVLKKIKIKNKKDAETYRQMLSVYTQHSDIREKLITYGMDKLSMGSWLVIYFIGFLLLTSLFYIKDTSIESIIFTALISSSVLILIIILKDLNNLDFGERAISFKPYKRVLNKL